MLTRSGMGSGARLGLATYHFALLCRTQCYVHTVSQLMQPQMHVGCKSNEFSRCVPLCWFEGISETVSCIGLHMLVRFRT